MKVNKQALFNTKLHAPTNNYISKELKDAYVQRGVKTNTKGKQTAAMKGPLDYYGLLKSGMVYRWFLKDGVIRFEESDSKCVQNIKTILTCKLSKSDLPPVKLIIDAIWLDKNNNIIADNNIDNSDNVFGKSGRLLVPVNTFIIPEVDPLKYRTYVESFGFKFIKSGDLICLPKKFKNDMIFVSYAFSKTYSSEYLMQPGKGGFIESHFFPQYFVSPNKTTKAYMIAGKWVDKDKNQLELIGFKIPYGYILISSENAIHGDSFTIGKMAVSFDVMEEDADVAYFRTNEYGVPKVSFVKRISR